MNIMSCCIKKDCIEYMRKMKWLICGAVMFFNVFLVLFISWALPIMGQALSGLQNTELESSVNAFSELSKMFPEDVRGSISAFLSMSMVYYCLCSILVAVGIIPKEIKRGKWIAPVNAGITHRQLLLSKVLTWSFLSGMIALMGYIVYYIIARLIFTGNFGISTMLWYGIWFFWSVFFISAEAMALSGVCGNKVVPLITILPCLIAGADIMSLFNIGRYLPTYIFTYTTSISSDEQRTAIIIPFLMSVAILILTIMWACKRVKKIKIG
ncbi:MAG: hypothetical protein ACI4DS_07640 [Eubacterium sp.]